MKRGVYEKLLPQKQNYKKSSENQNAKHNRFLITVNVLGSAGPIRFVVSEEDRVSRVIDTALKLFAREGRLPVLGSDLNNFLLFPAIAGVDALNPSELIGSVQGRTFVLSKKQRHPEVTEERSDIGQNGSSSGGRWKGWLNKPFNFKIISH